MNKDEMARAIYRIRDGVITDEEYKRYADFCRSEGFKPTPNKPWKSRGLIDRMEDQDKALVLARELREKQETEALKNKYKF